MEDTYGLWLVDSKSSILAAIFEFLKFLWIFSYGSPKASKIATPIDLALDQVWTIKAS
jgi:hypothetical protein